MNIPCLVLFSITRGRLIVLAFQFVELPNKEVLPPENVAEGAFDGFTRGMIIKLEGANDVHIGLPFFLVYSIDSAACLGVEVAEVAHAAHQLNVGCRCREEEKVRQAHVGRLFLEPYTEVSTLIIEVSRQRVRRFVPFYLAVQRCERAVKTPLVVGYGAGKKTFSPAAVPVPQQEKRQRRRQAGRRKHGKNNGERHACLP